MPASTPATLSRPVLVLLLGLAFVGALDQTVIASALPVLLLDLRVPFTDLDRAAWVITAYLLGYVAAMPVAGRLADGLGPRQVLLGALVVFGAGSLGAGLAPSLLTLEIARGIQAVGGGALLPVCLAVVGGAVPTGRRGLPLGLLGAAAELGGVAGPPYGALVAAHWGWRVIFLANLPLCVGLAGVIAVTIPSRGPAHGGRALEWRGALLLAAALAAFAVGTASSGSLTGNPAIGINRLALVPCAMLLGAFWWTERHSHAPLIPTAGIDRGRLIAAGMANLLVGIALITVLVDVPVYAAVVLNWQPETAGLLLARFMIFLPLGALAGGWLSDRLGRPPVAVAGFGLSAVSFYALAHWTAHTQPVALTAGLAVGGLGIGLVTAPIAGGALVSLTAAAVGTAASLVTALRIVGMMGGLAVLTTWGIWRFRAMMSHVPFPLVHLSTNHAAAQRQITAYQDALTHATVSVFSGIFLASLVVCLAGCLPALFLGEAAQVSQGHPGEASAT